MRTVGEIERGRVRCPRAGSTQALVDALNLAEADRERFVSSARAGRTRAVATPARQLPPDIEDLCGREAEIAQIEAVAGRSPAIIALSGGPGAGKTALAVRAGHLLAPRFPDGQLFVDLRGTDPVALDPGQALRRVLRSLDLTVHDYRSALRDRKILLVLDDAADARQVCAMLPDGPQCLVLVTSRNVLSNLHADLRLQVDPLAPDAAVRLLRAIVRRDHPAEEAAWIDEVASLCDHLPLALRIAGNQLLRRPRWSFRQLAVRLRDPRFRLQSLSAGDRAVWTALDVSYRRLTASTRAVFRRLALVPGKRFPLDLVAVAADVDPAVAGAALSDLVTLSLVGTTCRSEVWTTHDLVRLFAGEVLDRTETAEQIAEARARVGSWLARAEARSLR